MKFLTLFSEITETLDIIIALMILLYMWIRSHFKVKNKLNDLDDRLNDFDEYSSRKFSKIMQKLNDEEYTEVSKKALHSKKSKGSKSSMHKEE